MTSVAGDLMAIVWPAGATSPVGLIGAGRSGELASVEAVRVRGHETMPARGPLTVTVPGTVDAWAKPVKRFGSIGFRVVLGAALGVAHDGDIYKPNQARTLQPAAEVLEPETGAL